MYKIFYSRLKVGTSSLVLTFSSINKTNPAGWRTKSFCPLDCPDTMVYDSCGKGCYPTCADPSPDDCKDTCVEGCFCPPGLFFKLYLFGPFSLSCTQTLCVVFHIPTLECAKNQISEVSDAKT